MHKIIKKLTLYTSIFVLGATSLKIKESKEKSSNFTKKVEDYTTNFKEDKFLIAAHRGASSLAVENTKDAIESATYIPFVDYIEMDTRMTKDNKLVLSHNDNLTINNLDTFKISDNSYQKVTSTNFYHISNSLFITISNLFNTTNGNILINRANQLENEKYNIISLKEGLNNTGDKKIILDLKFDNNTKVFVDELTTILKDKNTDNILFQSNDIMALLYLKTKHPNYNCLALIKKKEDIDYIDLFDNIGIKKDLINKETVNKLQNKLTSVWTVNSPEDVSLVINNFKDNYKNIIYVTDYPEVVATVLNQKEKKLSKNTNQ